MELRIHQSINEVVPSHWNRVAGRNHVVAEHAYLRAVETARINGADVLYPCLYRSGELVAHAAVYSLGTELDSFARGGIKSLVNLVRRIWPDFLVMHTLECGSPVGLGSVVSVRPDIDQNVALNLLVDAVEQIAEQRRVPILFFRDYHQYELNRFDQLLARGYHRVANLPETRLQVRWDCFEEYLNAMRSQYRCKILAQIRRCREAGIVLERVGSFAQWADELTRLWHNAYDHAKEYRREILTPAFFRGMDRELGEQTAVIRAVKDNTLVGFLLLVYDDDVTTTLFSGLDYSVNRETRVYFNMFYEAIRDAMERGRREVDFGITTIAPKLDMGAELTPLYIYIRHRNPLLNRIVPRMFEVMTPKPEIVTRRVFKT